MCGEEKGRREGVSDCLSVGVQNIPKRQHHDRKGTSQSLFSPDRNHSRSQQPASARQPPMGVLTRDLQEALVIRINHGLLQLLVGY